MIQNQSKQQISRHTERKELKGILSEFRDALEEEIAEIQKHGLVSILLYAGRQIENHGSEYLYRFGVEYVPFLPPDTPCKLLIDKDQFDVTVISFEENSIILSAKNPLPNIIAKARLESGTTILMERLIDCIEANAEIKNKAGMHMLPVKGEAYSARRIFSYNDLVLNKKNTKNQNNAIISALSNDITYIWGPPGTGKTAVIGQIINELYKHGRSVLMVSHTNTAVDSAIEKADETYFSEHPTDNTDNASYPILRFGIPTKPLPERVLLDHHVALLGKELHQKKTSLEKQQTEIQNKINKILPYLAKEAWLNNSKLEEIREHLKTTAKYTKTINEKQNNIKDITAKMQQKKAAHLEYKNFTALSQKAETKRIEYNDICNQISKTKTAIKELPLQIEEVRDEIKKHSIYAELQAKKAKFMSPSFFRNKLAEIQKNTLSLESEIADLMSNRETAQQTVNNYEKKGAVAKFFSGKNAVQQAQATLLNINIRLPKAKQELQQQNSLEKDYKNQLEKLLVLQERINAVQP